MCQPVRYLLLPLAVAACVAAGVSSAVAQDASGANHSVVRAKRILESHLARHEFPGVVLALHQPSGASTTITAGAAGLDRAGAPIDSAARGPAAFIGAETLADVVGKDVAPPSVPSVSVGYRVFSFRPLRQVGTGERIGEVRVASQQTNVTYPIVANEGRTRLDLSVSYERLRFDYRNLTHPLESVNAISVTAFLTQKLTDAWSLILVAAPGYADDFEGGASLDAVTSAFVAAASRRFSDSFEGGLGVAIQNLFGEPLPLPVGSLNWTISERLWLRSILPISTELTWLPTDALGLRAGLLVNGGNYHGAERIYQVNNPQLNYSAVMAELGARWFILPFMHVTVNGGYTLYRRFEFSEGRDPVPGAEFDLSNGMMFGVALGFGR